MNYDKTTGALTMQWVPEVDASGRTRLVAHWSAEGHVTPLHAHVSHAA